MALHATHPNRFPCAQTRALGDLFDDTVAHHGNRECIVDVGVRLTFADLGAVVTRIANGLSARGVGLGDVVAYQLPNWWEAAAIFLATLRIGATVNPLLPIFRESELRFTLRQSGASVLFIPSVFRGCDHRALLAPLRDELPALSQVLVVRDDPTPGMVSFADLLTEAPAPAHSTIDPDSTALLMYTSGTTAEPKGVLHTHATLAAEVFSLQRVHALNAADRTLMPSPLTHISGVIHGILTPALLGTSAVLMDRWDPRSALPLLVREHVTYMIGAPTFLQDLLAQPPEPDDDTTAFRLFSCGGASVAPRLIEQARIRFRNCVAKRVYGSTEFPTISTTDAGDARTRGIDSEGRAIAPSEIRVVGESGEVVVAGEDGEIQARGPECFVGYLDPALNAEAFTADGWFRTGDLGSVDALGYLRISGRLKDIIIRKGEKISTKEVEDSISQHPAVREVAVLALPHADSGECAWAVLRLHPGTTLDLATLQAFLKARGLAKQKWPEGLQIVDDFPRTESGKVRRDALRQQIASGGLR